MIKSTDRTRSVVNTPTTRKKRRGKKSAAGPDSIPETFFAAVREKGLSEKGIKERGIMWLEDVMHAKAHALKCLDAAPRHMDALQHFKVSARRELDVKSGLPAAVAL